MWQQIRRVLFDLVIILVILSLFITKVYEQFPAALQLVALKALLVSSGILTAHIAGKLLFPSVVWKGIMSPAHYARIALYVVCVYAYSLGG